MEKKKPQIVAQKIVKPWRFRKCGICKKRIWPWQKRALLIVEFPNRIAIYYRCIKCHEKKIKEIRKIFE